MGTWGSCLYSNDTTSDIKGTYIDFVKDKLSDEDAYAKTYEQYQELIGTDEEPLFWYAMADTMWSVGRLTPEVKEKAEYFISQKGGIELWEEAGKTQKWIQTLESLNNKLSSPQPERKKLRRVLNKGNFWNTGDVYAYCFKSDKAEELGINNKYMLFQKIGEYVHDRRGEYVSPTVVAFDKLFDTIPEITTVSDLRPLMINIWDLDFSRVNSGCIVYQSNLYYKYLSFDWDSVSKKDIPGKEYAFLGNHPVINLDRNLPSVYGRNHYLNPVEEEIIKAYEKWHDVDYEKYFSYDNCVKRLKNGNFDLIFNPDCRKLRILMHSDSPEDKKLIDELNQRRTRVRYFPISSLPKSEDPIDKDLFDRLLQRFRSIE